MSFKPWKTSRRLEDIVNPIGNVLVRKNFHELINFFKENWHAFSPLKQNMYVKTSADKSQN